MPRSRLELKSAVDACLKIFPKACPHGPIGDLSVARVTDMNRMFSHTAAFNGDISKWDVSNARDMSGMFLGAKSFDGDLSKWDVSRATDMPGMFRSASSFNSRISKWDVSRVRDMGYMFRGASSFKQKLCGAAWVHSKATKEDMFVDSRGSISRTVCTATNTATSPAAFSPHSRAELRAGVDAHLGEASAGDCDASRWWQWQCFVSAG